MNAITKNQRIKVNKLEENLHLKKNVWRFSGATLAVPVKMVFWAAFHAANLDLRYPYEIAVGF
jgi:hypothetical protein